MLKLPVSWYDLKDSLWYRPALMTAMALILSTLTIQLDHQLFGNGRMQLPWLFQGGSEGARGVLSAIAGTMMTVATTAFSVTLVALQLGSSQFSPRILRNFTGDVGNQTVLGMFIATFAYSLSVLRTVRSSTEDYGGFVPTISVTIALLMAFASVGSLIFFFHHATRTIQASVVIDRTFNDASNLMKRELRKLDQSERRLLQEVPSIPEDLHRTWIVKSNRAGYLQDSNLGALTRIASEQNAVFQVHPQVGDYINPDARLVTIWRATDAEDEIGEDLADRVRSAFELGLERTLELDVLFGLQQLTDIALLAISPGTNDPSTAITAIDRIGTAVVIAEDLSGAVVAMADNHGDIRVLHPTAPFADILGLPFDQIRPFAMGDPNVVIHVLRTLEVIAGAAKPAHVDIVRQTANCYLEQAEMQNWIASDYQRVRRAADWAMLDSDPEDHRFTGRP